MVRGIIRGVYQVGGDGLSDSRDAAIYLVQGSDGALLVDAGTGEGTDAVVAGIRSAGTSMDEVRYLFLTHCHIDHAGGVPDLQAYGVEAVAHAKCAEILAIGDDPRTAASWYRMGLLPMTIDHPFDGPSSSLDLGDERLHLLHTPGHSPGSSVAYLDRDGVRILFGQDVHGPLHPSLGSDRTQYRAGLETLLALDADILCEGHYGIIEGAPAVRRFIEGFL